jgi:membrane protein YqaA with SNARE-associated domain
MDNRLSSFVKDALERGLPRADIAAALSKAGWNQADIASALDEYAEIDFPLPVPRRQPYGSAFEAFLYLLIFLCLFISAFSFGGLLFEFVDRWIPDPLQYSWNNDTNAIRGFTAALIVAFPLYLWLSTLAARRIRREPARRESRIRQWLTYVTLFIAAAVIIVDLITLLAGLLQGDLTLRFALKTLTVLLIAGLIFGYYLWELGQKKKK